MDWIGLAHVLDKMFPLVEEFNFLVDPVFNCLFCCPGQAETAFQPAVVSDASGRSNHVRGYVAACLIKYRSRT